MRPGLAFPLLTLLLSAAAAAQETIPVPPVEVIGTPLPGATRARSAVSDEATDPADLEAPEGPARAAVGIAGALVREQGGIGQASTLSLRGVSPQGTMATLDGVPLNSPFLGGADLSGLGLLPLDALAVTRGGLSASFGTDAVGGVLEARTPSVLDGSRTDLSLLYGSFNTARLKVGRTETFGPAGVGVHVGFLNSAGDFPFTDGNGRRRVRDHNAVLALDGLVKAEGRVGDHRLSLTLEGFWDTREVPGLEQFPSSTARQKDDRFVAGGAWTGPRLFGEDGRTWARVYARRLGFRFRDDAPPMSPPVATGLSSWGFGAEAGTEAQFHRLFALSFGAQGSGDLGAVGRTGQSELRPTRGTAAAWVGGRVGEPGGWWEASAAVRLEYDAGFGVRALPRGGARVAPLPWLKLFGNVTHGFRLPTFEELYFQAGFVQGNPDLEPEEALTWDAGIEFGDAARRGLRATYFETRGRNLILFLPRSMFLVRAENSGAATLRGLEAQGAYEWRWLRLFASYTFLDARFDDSGLRMPDRPAHQASGGAAVTVGPVRVTLIARGQTAFHLDRFESLSEEGRFLLDGRVEVFPHPAVTLSLDLRNLTDKRDAVDVFQYPLPGWAAYASVRVSL